MVSCVAVLVFLYSIYLSEYGIVTESVLIDDDLQLVLLLTLAPFVTG
jgi:hypothetical protein